MIDGPYIDIHCDHPDCDNSFTIDAPPPHYTAWPRRKYLFDELMANGWYVNKYSRKGTHYCSYSCFEDND